MNNKITLPLFILFLAIAYHFIFQNTFLLDRLDILLGRTIGVDREEEKKTPDSPLDWNTPIEWISINPNPLIRELVHRSLFRKKPLEQEEKTSDPPLDWNTPYLSINSNPVFRDIVIRSLMGKKPLDSEAVDPQTWSVVIEEEEEKQEKQEEPEKWILYIPDILSILPDEIGKELSLQSGDKIKEYFTSRRENEDEVGQFYRSILSTPVPKDTLFKIEYPHVDRNAVKNFLSSKEPNLVKRDLTMFRCVALRPRAEVIFDYPVEEKRIWRKDVNTIYQTSNQACDACSIFMFDEQIKLDCFVDII